MIIAIFGSQQPILPKRNFARFILMMFLIFCLVQRNVYQGALYIFLQSDGRHKPMQTINEMIENDFVFYMHSRFIELVQDHKEIFIRKKIANNDNELPFSKPVDDNLHAAYLTTEDEIMYRNKKTHKQYVLKVCDERFTLIDIVMYYQKNFYLKKSIDQRISQLLSSGILHHWIEKYIEERFLNVKEVSELKQLTVHHLFGVFNILLIGLAIACISLIIEITISKVKVYNRAKKSIRKKGLKRDAK
ncbi:hypothetical protein PVAND_010777 [Polypedilum vanderplanki]|nr:hypothetical protein PVAND_010777 [Polypedilum vanderplanki]